MPLFYFCQKPSWEKAAKIIRERLCAFCASFSFLFEINSINIKCHLICENGVASIILVIVYHWTCWANLSSDMTRKWMGVFFWERLIALKKLTCVEGTWINVFLNCNVKFSQYDKELNMFQCLLHLCSYSFLFFYHHLYHFSQIVIPTILYENEDIPINVCLTLLLITWRTYFLILQFSSVGLISLAPPLPTQTPTHTYI